MSKFDKFMNIVEGIAVHTLESTSSSFRSKSTNRNYSEEQRRQYREAYENSRENVISARKEYEKNKEMRRKRSMDDF